MVDVQNFLQPQERKLVLAAILLLLSFSFGGPVGEGPGGFRNFGFPLPALTLYNNWYVEMNSSGPIPLNLAINAVFWYLVACLVAYFFDSRLRQASPPQHWNYPPRY